VKASFKNNLVLKVFGVAALVFFIFQVTVVAGNAVIAKAQPRSFNDFSSFSEEEKERIEENLLQGVTSSNLGLQTSSAYFLGELKSSKAIIPLLKLLRDGETEEARIIAAISLYKLDSGIGMYRLKWYSVHEENELLKRNFTRIYNTYAANK
jgi:HEAT repeat protein